MRSNQLSYLAVSAEAEAKEISKAEYYIIELLLLKTTYQINWRVIPGFAGANIISLIQTSNKIF